MIRFRIRSFFFGSIPDFFMVRSGSGFCMLQNWIRFLHGSNPDPDFHGLYPVFFMVLSLFCFTSDGLGYSTPPPNTLEIS